MEEVIIAELVESEQQRPSFNAPNWLIGILAVSYTHLTLPTILLV